MQTTDISWSDMTWNCLRGCSIKSPGCHHCYAAMLAARFSGPGQPYEGLAYFDANGKAHWTGKIREVPEKLDEPLRKRKPSMIFVNSMSDLFHEDVSDGFIDHVFRMMAKANWHTYQVLTKRADRMADYCLKRWVQNDPDPIWRPLPNVWLGTSVENRKHGLPRIDHLRRTPAAVRFLSIEPLLEDLGEIEFRGDCPSNVETATGHFDPAGYDPKDCAGCGVSRSEHDGAIGWVIAGCESGPGARPMDEDWIRSIRDQCIAANVPFFYKQRLERGRKVETPELDGRQWIEMPTPAVAAL
jgi:protein gp37